MTLVRNYGKMLITDYLSTSSGGQISLSSPSMLFSQLASPWLTPHCSHPAKLLIYSNIAHPNWLETPAHTLNVKSSSLRDAWIWPVTSLCRCQGFLKLMFVLHFCYISCRFESYWFNSMKLYDQHMSFLFLESASGNSRASVRVLLWR